MTSLWRKWTSLVLAIALIVTLAPPGWVPKALAETVYFQFDNLSTEKTAPYEVVTNRINISGSFTGVSASSIGYRVERIMLDSNNNIIVIESTIGTTTPIISNNNSTFLFTSVEIYEGLNRIVVTGTNSAGNTVEGEGFVYFANNPVITRISANGETMVAGTPLLVVSDSANVGIMIYASNATEVTVNSTVASRYGQTTFFASVPMQPGYNRLNIVASNNGKTYAETRELILLRRNQAAVYDVALKYGTGADDEISLNTNQPLFINQRAVVKGKIAIPVPPSGLPTNPAEPEFSIHVIKDGTQVQVINNRDIAKTNEGTQSGFVVYSFETAATTDGQVDFSTFGEGNYTIRVRVSWGSIAANVPVSFVNMNPSGIYIKNIWRLFGAEENSGVVKSTGRSLFLDNSYVSTMPLWLLLETENGVPDNAEVNVKVFVDGVEQTSWNSYTVFESEDYVYPGPGNGPGYRVVRINSLPVGSLRLEFSVGTPLTKSVTFDYNAPAAIRIDNLYNGEKFTSPDGLRNRDIKFTLINFEEDDYESVTVTINGVTSAVDKTKFQNASYTFDVNVDLVPGPNTITVAGRARGVPVSTTITVYYFSELEPKIYNFLPVPPGEYDDPDGRIVRQGMTNQYVTEEDEVDILFNVQDFTDLLISADGELVVRTWIETTAGVETLADPEYDNNNTRHNVMLTSEGVDPNDGSYRLRLSVPLPENGGAKSITFSAKRGPVTVTHTLTFTHVVPAYRVLSPKMPEERVIKQNFVDVVIRAPGADRVEINKTAMTKDANDYIFRKRVTNLKVGQNRLKFSVYRGDQKVDGEIDITYAADYKAGAQYLAELPSSGKISVFGGNLQLTFPKNTYLRPADDTRNVDSLFASQPILFGIADRDGRTIKTENRDGTIVPIQSDADAQFRLTPKMHFGFASPLYWIDPGYVDVTDPNNYRYVEGDHPYVSDPNNLKKRFDMRDPVMHWLKPTHRGEITIKYDEALRNEAASTLSIWRYDGFEWVNLGGRVDTGKKTITTTFDGFGFYVVMNLRWSFNDIVGHDYARNALELMYARGIMNDKNDNEFGVYDNITRGEFAQMLVKMLNLELDYDINDLTFDDVPTLQVNPLWDWRYIETAARKGIVRGKGPRLFLPNEPLTREEAAIMIARAMNLLKGNVNRDKDYEQLKKVFTDGGLVSYYAASEVLAIYKAGFITGLPNPTNGSNKQTYRFDPLSNLKRADAAVIAERVMRKYKLL